MAHTIQYLSNNQINKKFWDECIDTASNGVVYGYACYLDALADNWDALILNEYEAVMPLPWRKKYGIYYLYQPAFTAQGGLFGNNLTPQLLEQFFKTIPKKFTYWHLSLNHANLFTLSSFYLKERTNFILYLNKSYQEIYKKYRENIKRNIKKANEYGCYVKKNIAIENIIQIAGQQPQQAGITARDFKNFLQLYYSENIKATTYGVYSKQHQLLASSVFFYSHNRTYYILVGNHPEGKTLGASHMLIDAFIGEHVGQNLILDFEGSDIQNLAFFYSGFGAVEEKYSTIKLNKLPWYVKWMKA